MPARPRSSRSYLGPPWIDAAPESPELLALCLRKLPGLKKKATLKDARFRWTEQHSKRIIVQLTVQKQVRRGAGLRRSRRTSALTAAAAARRRRPLAR